MYEECLLNLFENANIHIGKIDPRVIKAWFDTDCESLLTWMSTYITEDCYISAQQESEYSQLVLSNEQLDKEIKKIQSDHPQLLQVESNLFDIEVAKSTIDMLEDELKFYEHQISVNQQLHSTLLSELSTVSAKEIQSEIEEESAHANCMKLCRELDCIHSQTYDYIKKYGFYLSNYEYDVLPVFATSMDISEFDEKLSIAKNALSYIINDDNDVFEMSSVKVVEVTLSELENRIFDTRISKLALQMEIAALNSTLSFLENYDKNSLFSFIDYDAIQLSVGIDKDQQSWMLKIVEEATLKLVQQCVNQSTLQCLKSECEFYQFKLSCVNKIKDCLMKILLHAVIMQILYLQEKNDIKSSNIFFKNVNQYINNDLKSSNLRKEAMMRLISQFEEFCLSPIQNKFKLISDLGLISLKSTSVGMREVLESTQLLRINTRKLKGQKFNCPITCKVLEDLCGNIQVLEEFLISGPSSQMVTIPISLQHVLFNVNKILKEEESSVKVLINKAKNLNDMSAKDKWINYRNLLWAYFMTDGTKMLSFLNQLTMAHSKEKHVAIQ